MQKQKELTRRSIIASCTTVITNTWTHCTSHATEIQKQSSFCWSEERRTELMKIDSVVIMNIKASFALTGKFLSILISMNYIALPGMVIRKCVASCWTMWRVPTRAVALILRGTRPTMSISKAATSVKWMLFNMRALGGTKKAMSKRCDFFCSEVLW